MSLRPLADRLHAEIVQRADKRVEDALTRARDDVLRLYERQLQPLVGHKMGPMLIDVLHDAEREFAAQAKRIVEANEVDEVTRRLAGEVLKLEG